jgi:hypothetical protein
MDVSHVNSSENMFSGLSPIPGHRQIDRHNVHVRYFVSNALHGKVMHFCNDEQDNVVFILLHYSFTSNHFSQTWVSNPKQHSPSSEVNSRSVVEGIPCPYSGIL